MIEFALTLRMVFDFAVLLDRDGEYGKHRECPEEELKRAFRRNSRA